MVAEHFLYRLDSSIELDHHYFDFVSFNSLCQEPYCHFFGSLIIHVTVGIISLHKSFISKHVLKSLFQRSAFHLVIVPPPFKTNSLNCTLLKQQSFGFFYSVSAHFLILPNPSLKQSTCNKFNTTINVPITNLKAFNYQLSSLLVIVPSETTFNF